MAKRYADEVAENAMVKRAYFENQVVPHPILMQMREGLRKLHLRRLSDTKGRSPEGRILLIAGESGSGKSFGLKEYIKDFPKITKNAVEDGQFSVDDIPAHFRERFETSDYIPILSVEADKSTTSRGFAATLYGAFGYNAPTRWSSSDFTRRLVKLVGDTGVEMIFVDEAHHLINHQRETITENDVDFIKSLSNQLHIQIVLAGLPRVLDLADAMQMARRREPDIILEPYSWKQIEDRRIFYAVMEGFKNTMQIADPSSITDEQVVRRIYVQSRGYIGLASKHIAEALFRALERQYATIPLLLHAEVYHDFLRNKAGAAMRRRDWREEADVTIEPADRARNPFLVDDVRVGDMIDALIKAPSLSPTTVSKNYAATSSKSSKTRIRGQDRPEYQPMGRG